jgi:excisionase family DNA binding protein
MTRRKANPRLVKIHRSYTVEEAARKLGVHKNTVRHWLKDGLQPIDQRRPLLIHGQSLKTFLEQRRNRDKRRCGLGELYCMRCRAPRSPAERTVELHGLKGGSINLRARCHQCGTTMHKRASRGQLSSIKGILKVARPRHQSRLEEQTERPADCDLERTDEN